MKRLIATMAIAMVAFTVYDCSKIEENNDPVIGIWHNEGYTSSSTTNKQLIEKEWIFNDAYLGRYHRYKNNNLEFLTDYRWSQKDGVYTISYPGTDMPDDIVIMQDRPEGTLLLDRKGNVLALRE